MIKNEKGITLIALVVTIIILLILAGVSITTLSGDGLFGRAESSAAKYEQASQAENSTLSALMDKYDRYDTKEDTITLSWNSKLAFRGEFINSYNPSTTTSAENQDNKQIMAIKPNGEKILLNPYQNNVSVEIPKGTTIRFFYYRDSAAYGTFFDVYDPDYENYPHREDVSDGKLTTVDWVFNSDTVLASVGSYGDDISTYPGDDPNWAGRDIYYWMMRYNSTGGSVELER